MGNQVLCYRYHTCLVIQIKENHQTVQVIFNNAVGLNETFAKTTGEGPFKPMDFGDTFLFGFEDPEDSKQFYGKMADFNVWNRSLTSSEVFEFTQYCSQVNKTGKQYFC